MMLYRGNKVSELPKSVYDAIVGYMDSDMREYVHRLVAPCTQDDFLRAYIYADEVFADFLYDEFRVELDA